MVLDEILTYGCGNVCRLNRDNKTKTNDKSVRHSKNFIVGVIKMELNTKDRRCKYYHYSKYEQISYSMTIACSWLV